MGAPPAKTGACVVDSAQYRSYEVEKNVNGLAGNGAENEADVKVHLRSKSVMLKKTVLVNLGGRNTMRSRKSAGIDEAIIRLVTDLNDRIVIVEGKRDVAALEKAGIRTHVLTLDRLECIREFPEAKAVILTDFDRAGEIKLKKAESILISKGIAIDAELRERFRRIFGIRTIEDLPHILRQLVQ